MMVETEVKQVVNLTSHPIVIVSGTETITFPPSGQVCRVAERRCADSMMTLSGFGPIWLKLLPFGPGRIVGLPEPKLDGRVYLVSSMVLDSLIRLGIRRTDVFAPATRREFGAIRNDRFEIVGTTALMGIGEL